MKTLSPLTFTANLVLPNHVEVNCQRNDVLPKHSIFTKLTRLEIKFV